MFTLIGPATAVLQPPMLVSSTPSKINPQSIASLAAASAAAKIDTKPMDSAVPATSPAAATDKKAVAEAAAVTPPHKHTRARARAHTHTGAHPPKHM